MSQQRHKCCIANCDKRRKDVSFHVFPKNAEGLQKWLECIASDRLRSLSFEKLQKLYICGSHFEEKFYTMLRGKRRLCSSAYPTIFTCSDSGVQQCAAKVPIKKRIINWEHDYTKKRKHVDHTYCKLKVAERPCEKIDNALMVHNIDTKISIPSTSDCTNDSINKLTNDEVYTPPHTPIKKRCVVYNIKQLTPKCARLYREYKKSRRQLNFKKRVQRAIKLSKTKSFKELTGKLNPVAEQFIWMQIKQCTKETRGRRFTDDEKLIALSIMKQSAKCYRFLRKMFILPSRYTLNKMISKLNVEAGINAQIFDALKKEVNSWDEKKKFCSIIFDEVALETSLTYNKHKDFIEGFVNLTERTNDFADHALVFMLRGLVHKWQQPIAFYFCKGATSSIALKNILKDVVVAVGNAGLLPIALVCDQGTAFQSALKSLKEDTRRLQIISGDQIDDVILIDGHTLSVFYDPPHLLKGLRNNFLSKDMKFKGNLCKWSDIVEVYKTDCNHAQMRLLHKLNDEHVIPEKIKKMKVKNCVRVFSKTMAATLSYTAQFSNYTDGKQVSSTLKNTADAITFLDDLFDSVNGSACNKSHKGKPLRQAVTEKSPHHNFWENAILTLKQIKFIDKHEMEISVPSLKNWINTIHSYLRVWQYLKEKNIKILRPRYFNSDPIENFFGQVRAYNFRNTDPDCHTFKCTFKSLLITRFLKFHSENFNCEEDSGEQILKLKSLFVEQQKDESHLVCSPEFFEFSSAGNNQSTASQERLAVHSRAYATGWVIRKILKKIICNKCKENLTCRESGINRNNINNWISYREYKIISEKKLAYPIQQAVRLFGSISLEANKYLDEQPHKLFIKKK